MVQNMRGATESGSPFRPRRFSIRPLALKAGFGGVAYKLKESKDDAGNPGHLAACCEKTTCVFGVKNQSNY